MRATMANGNGRIIPRLDPGHWITLAMLVLQAVAVIAVVVTRLGAVERRLDVLDERLWRLGVERTTTSALEPCPADATRVELGRAD